MKAQHSDKTNEVELTTRDKKRKEWDKTIEEIVESNKDFLVYIASEKRVSA